WACRGAAGRSLARRSRSGCRRHTRLWQREKVGRVRAKPVTRRLLGRRQRRRNGEPAPRRLPRAALPNPARIVAPAAVVTTADQRLDLARGDADVMQRAPVEGAEQENGGLTGAPLPIGPPSVSDQRAGTTGKGG